MGIEGDEILFQNTSVRDASAPVRSKKKRSWVFFKSDLATVDVLENANVNQICVNEFGIFEKSGVTDVGTR